MKRKQIVFLSITAGLIICIAVVIVILLQNQGMENANELKSNTNAVQSDSHKQDNSEKQADSSGSSPSDKENTNSEKSNDSQITTTRNDFELPVSSDTPVVDAIGGNSSEGGNRTSSDENTYRDSAETNPQPAEQKEQNQTPEIVEPDGNTEEYELPIILN